MSYFLSNRIQKDKCAISLRETRRLGASVSLSLILSAAVVESAHSSNCDITPSDYDLVLSGNTGEVLYGDTDFERGESIAYALKKENPFKYSYSHAVAFKELSHSQLITQFFGYLSPLTPASGLWSATKDQAEDQALDQAKTLAQTPIVAAGAGKVAACPNPDLAFLDEIVKQSKNAIAEAANLRGLLKVHKTKYDVIEKSSNQFINNYVAPERVSSCQQAINDAAQVKTRLDSFNVDDFKAKVGSHSELTNGIANILKTYKTQNSSCDQMKLTLMAISDGLTTQSEALTKAANDLSQKQEQAGELSKLIEVGVAERFHAAGLISGKSVPGKANISISRKLRSPAGSAAEVKDVEVAMGRPLFSLSAGIAVSTIDEPAFGRVPSLVDGSEANMQLGERFALVDDGSPSILGALLLHANLDSIYGLDYLSPSLTLGVTIGDDENASAFGYLFGLSASFLNDNFHVTAGYHVRDVKKLAGEFQPGEVVPDDFPAEIPTTKTAEEGFVMVLSYKFM